MKISVVIPVYNEEKYLGACLHRFMQQTRKPDEIVVVDNNSTDRSDEVAKSFQGVRVVKEIKQGMAFARDRGFLEATGDVICQTDADSKPPLNWLSKIEQYLDTHKDVVAISGPVAFTEFPFSVFGSFISLLFARLLGIFFGHDVLFGPNKSIRVWALKKINPCSTNTSLHEDFDLAQHLSLVGGVVFLSRLVMKTSARRIYQTPRKFFFGYSKMLLNNLRHHPTTQSE